MIENNVTELPVGKFDAVRVLRELLRDAEAGEFDEVMVVYGKARGPYTNYCWSEMPRYTILWMATYLYRAVTCRYFKGHFVDD